MWLLDEELPMDMFPGKLDSDHWPLTSLLKAGPRQNSTLPHGDLLIQTRLKTITIPKKMLCILEPLLKLYWHTQKPKKFTWFPTQWESVMAEESSREGKLLITLTELTMLGRVLLQRLKRL